MTNITKALDELETATAFSSKSARDNHAKNIAALRAALQDKAVEVTVAIDNLYNERRDGMTNAIFPPVQIGTRLFAAQPAPVVPDGFALVPVEPTIGMLIAGMEHRISEEQPTHEHAVWAAMLAASQQKGGQ